ncbi:MAG: peptidylprolyl isomerase [Flavobacteriales bacterium Tduv]
MALLGKIRKHSWLLILAIGLALLAFVVDPKIFSYFMRKDPNIIGKVDGEDILRQEYVEQINFQKKFRQNLPEAFLNVQAWENLVDEKLLTRQAEKLGIQTGEKDFWKTLARKSIYSQVPYFQEKNGNFSTAKFKFYLSNLEKTAKKDKQASEELKLWAYQKQLIPKQLLAEQYLKMSVNGLNTTIVEAELSHQAKHTSVNIDYIFFPYSEYEKKNKISIKDEEVAAYINAHKARYKRSASRDLSLVLFPAQASPEDLDAIKKQVDTLASKFRTTINDSLFVSTHSEIPYNPSYHTEDSLPSFLKNFIKNASVGNIYGPTRKENAYIIAKLTGKKMRSESTKSNHILIAYKGSTRSSATRSKEQAKKIAERFYATIKANPNQFEALSQKSDDPSAIQNKGSLGWTKNNEKGLVPEYQKFLNENPKGAIGIIETPFGYHIIRIDDKSPLKPSYQLAIILKSINPSKKTEAVLYTNATRFLQENYKVNQSTFINNARKKRYLNVISKEVTANQPIIGELNSDSEIIRWAFDEGRNPGQTKLFTTPNGDYIVVYLSAIQSEGLASVEKVKNEVISILKKQKLAKIVFDDVKKSQEKDLEGLASALSREIKKTDSIIFENAILQGIGKEPKVVGAAFALPLKHISTPITGEQGVFIIRANTRIEAPKVTDYTQEIQVNNSILQKISIEAILKTLKDKAKIEDYRNKFSETNPNKSKEEGYFSSFQILVRKTKKGDYPNKSYNPTSTLKPLC